MPLALLSPKDRDQFVIRRLPAELAVTHRIVHRPDSEIEAIRKVKSALMDAAGVYGREIESQWRGML
jgi:hypothetical protein